MNNPPAFPNPHLRDDSGMTLRDYFAAKAMQGLLANPKLIDTIIKEGGAYSGWVEDSAWSWADAMLKARGNLIENSDGEKSISYLELTTRAHNVLKAADIEKIGQLIERVENSDTFLAKIPNCGKITEREIKNAVKEWQMRKQG